MTKEQEIQKNMHDLKISRAEAEELYAYDHEEIENAEAEALNNKAKQIKHYEKSGQPRKKADRPRKVDTEKKEILELLQKAIVEKTQIVAVLNEQKFSFNWNGNSYTVMLTKHRPPKAQSMEHTAWSTKCLGRSVLVLFKHEHAPICQVVILYKNFRPKLWNFTC